MIDCPLPKLENFKKNKNNLEWSLKLTKEDETTLGNFQTIINDENNEVLDLYKNAKKSGLKNVDAIDAKIVEDVDPAEALAN